MSDCTKEIEDKVCDKVWSRFSKKRDKMLFDISKNFFTYKN